MKQTGLIDRVIETLGLDTKMAKSKWTPAEQKPLTRDENGEPWLGYFSYASVVGMLLYLSGHTRPDIAYPVNCCARYMFCPRKSHEVAITDPSCVKSRTGFIITVARCPVLWVSKLQTETALSTMEAEIIALAHSCRELFSISFSSSIIFLVLITCSTSIHWTSLAHTVQTFFP
ncbi:hypothetical protein ACHAXR_009343 [Thalassiosira sp. AJA248-18]